MNIRKLVGIAGAIALLFGVLCLNYTKMGSAERHAQFARQRGWPEPSGASCISACCSRRSVADCWDSPSAGNKADNML
jgi:hypothetical protein